MHSQRKLSLWKIKPKIHLVCKSFFESASDWCILKRLFRPDPCKIFCATRTSFWNLAWVKMDLYKASDRREEFGKNLFMMAIASLSMSASLKPLPEIFSPVELVLDSIFEVELPKENIALIDIPLQLFFTSIDYQLTSSDWQNFPGLLFNSLHITWPQSYNNSQELLPISNSSLTWAQMSLLHHPFLGPVIRWREEFDDPFQEGEKKACKKDMWGCHGTWHELELEY